MPHVPDALLALSRLETPGCDISFAARENLVVPAHRHDTSNHVLVSEGVLYLTLDGVERPVRAGQWCTIPAGAEHAERFEERTTLLVFWLKAG
ncbi:MAG: cupin domain-containing protein [Gammaproteobacteria bacterium]|nr:cupin domain-containing protein [Gammaproteobacteria bacterium]